MLNKEKYEREIYMLCVGVLYMDDFKKRTTYKGDCFVKEFGMWANEECIEPFKITQAEKCILENTARDYTWIARDSAILEEDVSNAGLGLFSAEPTDVGSYFSMNDRHGEFISFNEFEHMFKFVTYKNSPLKISDILSNCEVIE